MGLMAQKLEASLALEGSSPRKAWPAMSADSGSLTMELARSLVQNIDSAMPSGLWAKSGREEPAVEAIPPVNGRHGPADDCQSPACPQCHAATLFVRRLIPWRSWRSDTSGEVLWLART